MTEVYVPLFSGAFNKSGLNNSRGWLVGWQPLPIPPPGQPGNQKPEQPGIWAFGSQSTYILPNPKYKQAEETATKKGGGPGANADAAVDASKLAPFIYMADRWEPGTQAFGSYVWLPLFIDPANVSRVRVEWHDSWTLENATSPFL